jgi:hypothetical protein
VAPCVEIRGSQNLDQGGSLQGAAASDSVFHKGTTWRMQVGPVGTCLVRSAFSAPEKSKYQDLDGFLKATEDLPCMSCDTIRPPKTQSRRI